MANHHHTIFAALLSWGALGAVLTAEAELLNLESFAQDFVISSKQIEVPGYPGAFNASIIRWQGELLLCFRVRDEKMVSTFEIGLVWLDDDFNVVSVPTLLDIRNDDPACLAQRQDPRLVEFEGRLYIIYSNFIKIEDILTRRMFIAELQQNEQGLFFIEKPLCIHPFEGWTKRWEKNWVPFVYDHRLLLAYSLLPHRIFEPSLDSGECTTVASTSSSIEWNWGDLRGGTPALKDGNEYIAFFHSSKNIATTHSEGKVITHYVMGAYTFSAELPFEITSISPHPIVGEGFYGGPSYTTWKPLRVAFPMGCLLDEEFIWITYGRQDFEIWVAKLDKKKLYASLVPVTGPTAHEGIG